MEPPVPPAPLPKGRGSDQGQQQPRFSFLPPRWVQDTGSQVVAAKARTGLGPSSRRDAGNVGTAQVSLLLQWK